MLLNDHSVYRASTLPTKEENRSANFKPQPISTSFVGRQNLTMQMSMRRFTRSTNAFSKKLENLEAAVALHYFHYNFMRIHETIRVTPAMEAKIENHIWSWEQFLGFSGQVKKAA